jgi:hypothetical protein
MANHLGFRRVDRAIAADRLAIYLELLDDVIAIRVTAARFAKLDTATQPAARLVGEVQRKRAFIVPLRPTCRCVTSPSDVPHGRCGRRLTLENNIPRIVPFGDDANEFLALHHH